MKSRLLRLARFAQRQEPLLVIVKYVSPEDPDPEPPEEVKRAALEEARREGKAVAVVYWPPREEAPE